MVKNGYFLLFSPVDFIRIPQINQNVITLLAINWTDLLSWNYYNSFSNYRCFCSPEKGCRRNQPKFDNNERDMSNELNRLEQIFK